MIKRYKKIPLSRILSIPKNELLISKDGDDVNLFIRLDGKVYDTSFSDSISTATSGTGGSGGGVSTFIDLTDTDPTGYAGNAGKSIIGNAGETGLTFGQAIRTTDSPTFAGIVISAVTAGNVLSANGTAFVGVTPETAGLAKPATALKIASYRA